MKNGWLLCMAFATPWMLSACAPMQTKPGSTVTPPAVEQSGAPVAAAPVNAAAIPVAPGLPPENRVWHLQALPIGMSYRGASQLDAFLKFDPAAHVLTGHTGCNGFEASYTMGPDAMSVSDFKAARNICYLGVTFESMLIQSISSAQQWTVADGTLTLKDGTGEPLSIWRMNPGEGTGAK